MALLPAFLLALFGAWSGTLPGGATFSGQVVGIVALLFALVLAPPDWGDPLRLGSLRWLPWILWVVVVLSAATSPVLRAGWVGLILLPGFLAVPGVTARCWADDEKRRVGLRGVAVVLAGSALWALLAAVVLPGERSAGAAMPLGHHTLLAAWLVLLSPLVLPLLADTPPWRWFGGITLTLAALTTLATASSAGIVAALVEVGLGFVLLRSARLGWPLSAQGRRAALLCVALLGGLGVALVILRGARIAQGADLSWQLRAGYLNAAWRGLVARPWLGWGPGAVAWTSAEFLRPVPGGNPWGEVVGELHSLPAQLAYELGSVGLLVVVALVLAFAARRRREWRSSVGESTVAGTSHSAARLAAAGLVALAGGVVVGCGTGAVRITALPLAAAVAAGAALMGGPAPRAGFSRRVASGIYAVLAVAALALPCWALWHYDRAVEANRQGSPERALRELAAASRWDPRFPLYSFRRALLLSHAPRPDGDSMINAERAAAEAAQDGVGLAPLWLAAGIFGRQVGAVGTRQALEKSCTLDPLDPFPSFYAMAADPEAPDAAELGALSLLAEPRLAAATFWEDKTPLFGAAVAAVRGWQGVDAGWREAFAKAAPAGEARTGSVARLSLGLDLEPALSFSLHAFRRRPWPTEWPLISVRRDLLPALRLPPATSLRSTFLGSAPGLVCGLGNTPPSP
jgi:hypothetical protein